MSGPARQPSGRAATCDFPCRGWPPAVPQRRRPPAARSARTQNATRRLPRRSRRGWRHKLAPGRCPPPVARKLRRALLCAHDRYTGLLPARVSTAPGRRRPGLAARGPRRARAMSLQWQSPPTPPQKRRHRAHRPKRGLEYRSRRPARAARSHIRKESR